MGFLDNYINETKSRSVYGKTKGSEAFEVLVLEFFLRRLPYGPTMDKVRLKYSVRNQGKPLIYIGANIPINL